MTIARLGLNVKVIDQGQRSMYSTYGRGNGSNAVGVTSILYRGQFFSVKGKGRGFPYSLPSVGPGADPGVQAVSPQVTISHPPGGRLPLLFTRPAVTYPAAEHHRSLAGTKLYCLVTEAHRCEHLAQWYYAAFCPE